MRDKTVRWHAAVAAAAAAADDDDDDDDDAADGSQRFEFVLERYWPDVTQMSLQCSLMMCNKMSASYRHTSPVCT